MIARKPALLLVALTALSTSGCVSRLMDFTVISTKNVEIPGVRGEKVTGEDMKSIIIAFPTGQPSIKAAVDDALDKGHGDVLLDAVISNRFWYIPYVFGRVGFVVEGTALKTYAPGTAPAAIAVRPRERVKAPAAPDAATAIAPAAVPAEAPPAPASVAAAEPAPEEAAPASLPKLSAREVAAELLP